jgi:hypothetical protein
MDKLAFLIFIFLFGVAQWIRGNLDLFEKCLVVAIPVILLLFYIWLRENFG